MADDRPRPRYGEYATPQDQAALVAKSLPPVSPLLTPADRPGEGTAQLPQPRSPGSDKPAPIRRRWDLLLSIALLAYGLVTVLSGIALYSDVPALIDQLYESQGIGAFTPTELARSIGVAVIVVNFALYIVTTLVTIRLLRARRLSFYVPLIGGALSALISVALIFIVMFDDSAFVSYISSVG